MYCVILFDAGVQSITCYAVHSSYHPVQCHLQALHNETDCAGRRVKGRVTHAQYYHTLATNTSSRLFLVSYLLLYKHNCTTSFELQNALFPGTHAVGQSNACRHCPDSCGLDFLLPSDWQKSCMVTQFYSSIGSR